MQRCSTQAEKSSIKKICSKQAQKGLTLVELLFIPAILGILIFIMGMNLRSFGNDLENAVQETAGFFKHTRVKAISTTSAYRIVYGSNTRLMAEHAMFCNSEGDWQRDSKLDLELREGIAIENLQFEENAILLCFNSRGFSTENLELEIVDAQNKSRVIEVYLGGAVVIQ